MVRPTLPNDATLNSVESDYQLAKSYDKMLNSPSFVELRMKSQYNGMFNITRIKNSTEKVFMFCRYKMAPSPTYFDA